MGVTDRLVVLPVVLTIAPNERWCLCCGETALSWVDTCPRCEGTAWVLAADVLRPEEWREAR